MLSSAGLVTPRNSAAVRAPSTSLSSSKQERLDALRNERLRIMQAQASLMARPRSVARSSAVTPAVSLPVVADSVVEKLKDELRQARISEDLLREKNAETLAKEKERVFVLASEKQKLEMEMRDLKMEKFRSEQLATEADALRHQLKESQNWKGEKESFVKQIEALKKDNDLLKHQVKNEKSQRLILAASLEQVQKELHDATRSSILSSVPSVPERRPTMLDSETIQIFSHSHSDLQRGVERVSSAQDLQTAVSFIDIEQRGSAKKGEDEDIAALFRKEDTIIGNPPDDIWGRQGDQDDPFAGGEEEKDYPFARGQEKEDYPFAEGQEEKDDPFAGHGFVHHTQQSGEAKNAQGPVTKSQFYFNQAPVHESHQQPVINQANEPAKPQSGFKQIAKHAPSPQVVPQQNQRQGSYPSPAQQNSHFQPQPFQQHQPVQHAFMSQTTPQFQQKLPVQTPLNPSNIASATPHYQSQQRQSQPVVHPSQTQQGPPPTQQTPSHYSAPAPSSASLPSHSLLRNNIGRSTPTPGMVPPPSQPSHPAFTGGKSPSGRSTPFQQPSQIPSHPSFHQPQPHSQFGAQQQPVNPPQYQQNMQYQQPPQLQPHHQTPPQFAQPPRQGPPNPTNSNMYPSGPFRY